MIAIVTEYGFYFLMSVLLVLNAWYCLKNRRALKQHKSAILDLQSEVSLNDIQPPRKNRTMHG